MNGCIKIMSRKVSLFVWRDMEGKVWRLYNNKVIFIIGVCFGGDNSEL